MTTLETLKTQRVASSDQKLAEEPGGRAFVRPTR